MILIDANVILDVLSADKTWASWSGEQLKQHSKTGSLRTNEIVYAELCVGAETREALDTALKELKIEIERTPTEALYLAAKAFRRYRAAGGPRLTILPDFFIGAFAQISRRPLLTRDPRRFRTHFQSVRLITP